MKRKMKKLIHLFVLLPFLVACDTDDSPEPDSPVIDQKLGTFTGKADFTQYYSDGSVQKEYKEKYCTVKVTEYAADNSGPNYYKVDVHLDGFVRRQFYVKKGTSTPTLFDSGEEQSGRISISSSSCTGSVSIDTNGGADYNYSWNSSK